jgi:endo-1,4-beta-xylanase
VGGAVPTIAADTPGPGLSAIASERGRRFGNCISFNPWRADSASIQNAAYADLVASECGLVVPENEMKWQALRPAPDQFDFTRMDAIADWARARGLGLRGHTLLWARPQWFPQWLNDYDFGARPAIEAERLLTSHISKVMERYANDITSWDVVNEAIDHDGHGILETSLSRAMGSGEATLDLAFHAARNAAPDAQLVYNDYMSWEPQHEAHCDDVLRLLEGFRKRGTPVDALGIQSHIEIFEVDPATGNGPYRERGWRAFLDEVVGMGYKVLLTEFDVKDKALPSDIAIRDAKVADFARRYLDLTLSYPQVGDVLAWGMVDKYSWLQGFAPRDDGTEVRCCPYGSDYQAKPLRDALAERLRGAARAV